MCDSFRRFDQPGFEVAKISFRPKSQKVYPCTRGMHEPPRAPGSDGGSRLHICVATDMLKGEPDTDDQRASQSPATFKLEFKFEASFW